MQKQEVCARVQGAYELSTQTGGGPERSRAARGEGCNSTKKLPTPHLEKSPTGAQAMVMPSVCLLQSTSFLGTEKSWHTEVGSHFPTTPRPVFSVLSPLPICLLLSFIWVLFILPFDAFVMIPSSFPSLCSIQEATVFFLLFFPVFTRSFLCLLSLFQTFCSPF